jgi:cytochrome c oxidase assembly protein subunit 15
MLNIYRAALRFSLAAIFLVVLAGAVVRMSGSGMGCPDWPKCFGYYIPPTNTEQVLFTPENDYKKGQMIVHSEKLWKAKSSFTSSETFDAKNWEEYTKHDYAIFNPLHTWIEFINRLLGAFSGIPVLIVALTSFQFIKRKPILTFLGVFTLLMLLFQAWLGKLVVDGNLIPNSITIHMFGALVIVALLIAQIFLSVKTQRFELPKKFKSLTLILIILIAVQVVLGTQVREEVDYLFKDDVLRANIIDELSIKFLIHRSISQLILIIALYMVWKLKGFLPPNILFWLKTHLVLIVAIIFTGVLLNYFGFVAWAQPVHLLLGFGVFATIFWFWLNLSGRKA